MSSRYLFLPKARQKQVQSRLVLSLNISIKRFLLKLIRTRTYSQFSPIFFHIITYERNIVQSQLRRVKLFKLSTVSLQKLAVSSKLAPPSHLSYYSILRVAEPCFRWLLQAQKSCLECLAKFWANFTSSDFVFLSLGDFLGDFSRKLGEILVKLSGHTVVGAEWWSKWQSR